MTTEQTMTLVLQSASDLGGAILAVMVAVKIVFAVAEFIVNTISDAGRAE